MADDKTSTFPMIPITHWWALRSRFQTSIPGIVTASYIASALNMKESSARANVIPTLRQVGLIAEDGKPTEKARQWRDNAQYPTLCRQILKDLYPAELRDACPDPVTDRACAERWFANHTGSGEIAVGKMTAFYVLLFDADASKSTVKIAKTAGTKVKTKVAGTSMVHELPKGSTPKKTPPEHASQDQETPSIHLNLEVHISADASPDQIDKIFESMARHIYNKK